MPRKISEKASVAWLNGDHPDNHAGESGYFIVEGDPEDHSHSPKIGRRVLWVKSSQDDPDGPPNHENNEGHFVFADDSDDEE